MKIKLEMSPDLEINIERILITIIVFGFIGIAVGAGYRYWKHQQHDSSIGMSQSAFDEGWR